jgi:hypothetical protein
MAARSFLTGALALLVPASFATSAEPVDICVYGATPAGVVAAVTARQEGRSVLLIEPSRWLGGILGAGLKPTQDCPEPSAVGGLTKTKVFRLGEDPASIRAAYAAWLRQEGVEVVYEQRVRSVEKSGAKIVRIRLEKSAPDAHGVPPARGQGPGRIVVARVFIDASYEGDLMAQAGVRYASGREARSVYNEQPAGVNPPTNWTAIDPYVRPGDPGSGLLPLVDADYGKALGEGDDYTQAYNFRFYVTSDSAKRMPFDRPANYSPARFELVGRYVAHLVKKLGGDQAQLMKQLGGIFPGWKNRGEYNYQRASLVTIAPLGVSRYYQDGDWAARSRIWREHIEYLSGLHTFISTDERVPEMFRLQTAALGLERAMHADTGGWPNQLYVRITRRMSGRYVLTHADVLNRTTVDDSVGLALYGVDTYPVRRYAARDPKSGQLGVATEGNMFLGGGRGTGVPYAVPYRAIVPQGSECTNLIVPVCFSASYIAYASARMEPVFCVLGESAAVAAAHAIRDGVAVQEVKVPALQQRLLERGQILEWKR